MEKEKRKRGSARHISTQIYIFIGILLLLGMCTIGFSIGLELNNDELQGLTQTQNIKATQNPMAILAVTQQAIETQWADLQVTRTAISELDRSS